MYLSFLHKKKLVENTDFKSVKGETGMIEMVV